MRVLKPTLFAALFVLAACGGGGEQQPPEREPPQGVLSPGQLFFGRVGVGQTSGPRTAVLTNPGDQPLIVSRIEYSSNDIANFQVEHNCPQTIAPGGSCTVTFFCAPVQAISGNVTVYIYNNGSYYGPDLEWHLQTYSHVTLTCFT
jgi:Abnormal spindle-like microcephaly-assoc'd, ASPM-SPD-2-Hydin